MTSTVMTMKNELNTCVVFLCCSPVLENTVIINNVYVHQNFLKES